MNPQRRALLVGASLATAMAIAGCATTGGGANGPSFATVQTYVAEADAVLDKLIPVVAILAPATAAQLHKLQTDADTAAAAFAALTSPAGAATPGQALLTAIGDAFSVIEAIPGLPPDDAEAIGAAQLLLVALGTFINAPAKVSALATTRYACAPDRAELLAWADVTCRRFIRRRTALEAQFRAAVDEARYSGGGVRSPMEMRASLA